MQLSAYLGFKGECATAFKFYERCFGGKLELMLTYGESPMADQVTPASREQIIHARLRVGNTLLMGSDAPPDHYQQPKGLYVSVGVDTVADAERIFGELAEKGGVQMPMTKTFFAERFGMVTDRFGIAWMVNCEPAA
ncbi:MAG TPA: VOC family protein [Candidatus Binataceae bacterium]|nr:VOC family protein [Candidatus Binataceae bacterium]